MKKVFVFVIAVFAFSGCRFYKNGVERGLNIRTSLVSESNGVISVSVWPENMNGDISTGAVVSVTDPSNQVWLCEFNNQKQAYVKDIESSFESFKVNVKSELLESPFEKTYAHKAITEKPVVKVFSDESGNSVISGNALNGNEELLVAWDSLGEGVVYNVQIRSALSVKWKKSCSTSSISVPSDTLSAGTYYIQVTAQWISGDPYFKNDDYYSQSTSASSSLSFFIN